MVNIVIKGGGEVRLALVDQKGNTLLRKRLIVSGSEGIEVRSRLPLELETRRGRVAVVPVVVSEIQPQQQVTFDGQKPAAFIDARCRRLKIAPRLLARALAEAPAEDADGLVLDAPGAAAKRR
jgi:hypothetical protein